MSETAVITIAGAVLGILQAAIFFLLHRTAKSQDAKFQVIETRLTAMNGFKDKVLEEYPKRAEVNAHELTCERKFSEIFGRLRDIEKG